MRLRTPRVEWPKQPPAAPAAVTIAVLPFSDLSANHDQEYFSDGLAEELLNALGRVPGLRVTARVSSFRFKGANPDPETIGRKLNVANLVEGSVRRDGRRLRIGVRLVDAQNGFQRWSSTYERQMDDIFAVQEEIARSVVAALQVTLLASPASIVALQTKNPEAYTAGLQARHFWTRRGQGDLERAAASFKKVRFGWEEQGRSEMSSLHRDRFSISCMRVVEYYREVVW